MAEFRMPALGADMEQGTVVEWRVRPGDRVKRGDIVALVETEKGLIEIEIFDSGIVESVVVAEGSKVPVGTVLAMIRSEAPEARPASGTLEEARPAEAAPPVTAEGVPRPPTETLAAAPAQPSEVPRATGRARVSPMARKRAAELGVDLCTLRGSGEGGAITQADVERAAAPRHAPLPPQPPPTAAPTTEADRQAAMRRAIAAAMARSKREIPHYYLGTQIDMSLGTSWLAAENAQRPVTDRLLYGALLIRAVGLAVRQFPEMNGFYTDNSFRPSNAAHVGVAIALRQGGLVAPAIHDVDKKSIEEITRGLLDLVQRARAGVLRGSEVSDATITVTSLGEQGTETVFGVIYPPQVALVGFGKIVERPWASNGMIGARPVIVATLAGDHRVSDGHRGGRFLTAIDRLLQEPEKL